MVFLNLPFLKDKNEMMLMIAAVFPIIADNTVARVQEVVLVFFRKIFWLTVVFGSRSQIF